MSRTQMFLGMTKEQVERIIETEKAAETGATFYGQAFSPELRERLDRIKQGLSPSGFTLDQQARKLRSQGVFYEGLE